MEQLILVQAESPGRYTAQAVAFPECRAVAGTEADAIEQVKQSLAVRLSSAKLVRVEVPLSGTGNPWLDTFGRSAADPEFAAYQEELQNAREDRPRFAG